MRRNEILAFTLLLVVGLLTAWVFASVLDQRFSSGEAYPIYSTLRSDPLGSKALYEALDRLPNVESSRNYRDVSKLVGDKNSVLVLQHLSPGAWTDGAVLNGKAVQAFAAAGGRVIITLNGQNTQWGRVWAESDRQRNENARERLKEKLKEEKKEKKEPAEKEDEQTSVEDKKRIEQALFKTSHSLAHLLGVNVKDRAFVLTARGADELIPSDGFPFSKGELPLWHSRSSLEFSGTGENQWQVLATVKDNVALAVREIGQGSIVIATDSYFMSNEGLSKEPAPLFLAWLFGNASSIVFEETHLGTKENPGIMTLVQRYHLHGLFLGALLVFALFVWRSSTSLLPARSDLEATTRAVAGQGATAGLVSLLKRGIPRKDVLQRGFDAWEKTVPHPGATMKSRIEKAREFLATASAGRLTRDARVDLYQQLCDILHPKRK